MQACLDLCLPQAHVSDESRYLQKGELVYAGMDWVDETLAKRSMTLMAEQVMPRVRAAIDRERR